MVAMNRFLFLYIFLFFVGCTSKVIKSPDNSGFVLNYFHANAKIENKFVAETKIETRIDSRKNYKIILSFDSKLDKLILKEPGRYRVEYEIDLVPIVYENLITGGSLSIEDLVTGAGMKTTSLTEIVGKNNVFDLSKIFENLPRFEPSVPKSLVKHCKNFSSQPCDIKPLGLRLYVYKEVLSHDPWVPLFSIDIETVYSYDNQDNFYKRDLVKLRAK